MGFWDNYDDPFQSDAWRYFKNLLFEDWNMGFHSVKNICKALFCVLLFIGVCAGMVFLLVSSSNAKAARGGHGFGVSWSLSDRSEYIIHVNH